MSVPPDLATHLSEPTQIAVRYYGTLIVSARGRIEYCDHPAAEIFGSNVSALADEPISSLIPSLAPKGSTPSFNAQPLQFVGSRNGWHSVDARSRAGSAFRLEVLACRMAITEEVRLILRVPEGTEDRLVAIDIDP
jgi:hypothetical protein